MAAVHEQPVTAGVVEVQEDATAGQSEAAALSGSHTVRCACVQ